MFVKNIVLYNLYYYYYFSNIISWMRKHKVVSILTEVVPIVYIDIPLTWPSYMQTCTIYTGCVYYNDNLNQ